jgi:hypothetical protein
MPMLGELLFPPADYRRTTLSTIAWWESRRLKYNLVVGAAGIVTVMVTGLISLVPPGLPMAFDWRPIVAYGLLANVCYSVGWFMELMMLRLIGKRAPAIGPAMFRQGLAFSVGLTLLPIPIISAGWLVHTALLLFR